MSGPLAGGSDARPAAAPLGPADWLGLAAAPTFAIMAVLTGGSGADAFGMVCGPAHDASPLAGMGAMYLLMSAFHSPPWLKLIARWEARGSSTRRRQREM